MRASLRAAAAVPTSVGRLSLSMSVGVHSGDIDAVPRRVADPRAARARPRRDRRRPLAEKAAERRRGRRQPGDRGPAAPPARPARATTAPWCCAAGTRTPHRATAASVPPDRADRLRTLFPTALGEYLAPGRARPRAPGRHHRVRAVLRHRRASSHSAGPQALAERAARAGQHGRGGTRGRGRHPAGHRPRHRRREVLPRLGRAEHPRATTRARCCARCGGSRTPACPCRSSSGVNRGHVFAAEVGVAERAALLRDGRHHEHGGADHGHRTARHGARAPGGARPLAHAASR